MVGTRYVHVKPCGIRENGEHISIVISFTFFSNGDPLCCINYSITNNRFTDSEFYTLQNLLCVADGILAHASRLGFKFEPGSKKYTKCARIIILGIVKILTPAYGTFNRHGVMIIHEAPKNPQVTFVSWPKHFTRQQIIEVVRQTLDE